MTVKELREMLNRFEPDMNVCISQIYNSSGGIREIEYVCKSNYEENTVVLEPKD